MTREERLRFEQKRLAINSLMKARKALRTLTIASRNIGDPTLIRQSKQVTSDIERLIRSLGEI